MLGSLPIGFVSIYEKANDVMNGFMGNVENIAFPIKKLREEKE
jgi:hypothetical protein